MGGTQEKLLQPPQPPKYSALKFNNLYWIEDEGFRIPSRFVEWKNKHGERAHWTIIYSSGHNEDLFDTNNTVSILKGKILVFFFPYFKKSESYSFLFDILLNILLTFSFLVFLIHFFIWALIYILVLFS